MRVDFKYLFELPITAIGPSANAKNIPNSKLPHEKDKEYKEASRRYAIDFVGAAYGVEIATVLWKNNRGVRLTSIYVGVMPILKNNPNNKKKPDSREKIAHSLSTYMLPKKVERPLTRSRQIWKKNVSDHQKISNLTKLGIFAACSINQEENDTNIVKIRILKRNVNLCLTPNKIFFEFSYKKPIFSRF